MLDFLNAPDFVDGTLQQLGFDMQAVSFAPWACGHVPVHCTEVRKDWGIFIKEPQEVYDALTAALPELIQFCDDDACLPFVV